MARKKQKQRKQGTRINVPGLSQTITYPMVTVTAETALTDMDGTLGTTTTNVDNRSIHIRLNVSHPGIRAAALSRDHHLLNCYVAEMTFMTLIGFHEKNGEFPWPHDEWPEFLTACNHLG